jgi:hypothetical protein
MSISNKKSFAQITAIILGIITLALGYFLLMETRSAGFPFGDLTEYDRAVAMPHTVLAYFSMLAGVYFFYLAAKAKKIEIKSRLIATIGIYIIIFFGLQFGLEYYYKHFTDINYGQGG